MFSAYQAKHAYLHANSCTATFSRKPYAKLMDAAFMAASLFLIVCLLAVFVSIRLWLPLVVSVWFMNFCRKQESRLSPR